MNERGKTGEREVEPKASLLTLTLFAMLSDAERASVPASIGESFHERDPARATTSGSSGQSLSNADRLLFSFAM